MTIHYPVKLRQRTLVSFFYAGAGAAWAAATAFIAVMATVQALQRETVFQPIDWIGVIAVAPMIGFGIFMLLMPFLPSMTLFENRLEYRFLWREVMVERPRVVGIRRTRQSFGCIFFVLVLDDGRHVRVAAPRSPNPAFNAWFSGIENLDARDAGVKPGEQYALLLANPAFGATPDVRRASVIRHRRIIALLMIAASLLGIWEIYFPSFWPTVACLIIPPLVIFVRLIGGERYDLTGAPPRSTINIGALAITPGASLAATSLLHVHIDNWKLAAVWMAGLSIVVTVLVVAADRRAGRVAWIIGALIGMLYAVGLLFQVNTLVPQAPVAYHVVHVVGKDARSVLALTVTDWRPGTQKVTMRVPLRLFRYLQPGQAVLVETYPGALGIGWDKIGGTVAEGGKQP